MIDEMRPETSVASSTPQARSRWVPAGILGRVRPNSRAHWTLLAVGVAGSALFNAVYVVDGLLRPGYASLRYPMSALSLGPAGWVQVANFIVFGVVGCASASAWRATLAPGRGSTWNPRLRVLSGLALICAGIFTQDPGAGFPLGVAAPAHPSTHALIHNMVSYISLVTTVIELLILAGRFRGEPRWRAWAPVGIASAVLMMAFLAAFGALVAGDGPAGLFEKLASFTPTVFGVAVVIRLFAEHEARIRPYA